MVPISDAFTDDRAATSSACEALSRAGARLVNVPGGFEV